MQILSLWIIVPNYVATRKVHPYIHRKWCRATLLSNRNNITSILHNNVRDMFIFQKWHTDRLFRIKGILAVIGIDMEITLVPHVSKYRAIINAYFLAETSRYLWLKYTNIQIHPQLQSTPQTNFGANSIQTAVNKQGVVAWARDLPSYSFSFCLVVQQFLIIKCTNKQNILAHSTLIPERLRTKATSVSPRSTSFSLHARTP